MKLSLNHFTKVNQWYEPTLETKRSDYYQALRVKHRKVIAQGVSLNWIFLVSKQEVFDILGWDIDYMDSETHLDSSLCFPEFKNPDQLLLLLVTSISLHNELVNDNEIQV